MGDVLAMSGSLNGQAESKLKDEDLKLKEIDQLHSAVTEFSKKCFEIKKLFVTLVSAAATFIIKFNGNKIDYKTFGVLFIVIILFWTLDAESYYYQEKLRHAMKKIMNEIRGGRNISITTDGVGIPLSKKRKENTMAIRAYFNVSQSIYIALGISDLIFGVIFYLYKWVCQW